MRPLKVTCARFSEDTMEVRVVMLDGAQEVQFCCSPGVAIRSAERARRLAGWLLKAAEKLDSSQPSKNDEFEVI